VNHSNKTYIVIDTDNCTKQIKREINEKMDANKSNIEHIEFITFIKSARRRSSTAAQLRHENAGLLQIIADFDTRLATVEAERDELQQRLDSVSKLPVIDLSQHRRISRTGSLSRDII
jgi:hypothetical protein